MENIKEAQREMNSGHRADATGIRFPDSYGWLHIWSHTFHRNMQFGLSFFGNEADTVFTLVKL